MKYKLTQDNDSHWYKIPVDKQKEFDDWLNIDSDNEESWTPPDFAAEIDSPESFIFEEPVEVKINSAVDLSKYKSNSMIIAKIDESILRDENMLNGMKRLFDDLRKKVDIDDSTHFVITTQNVDVSSWTEQEMSEFGWAKK